MRTVLLIEDEATLRRAVERRLAKRHDVHTAATAAEAEALFRRLGGILDVVVTDVRLPDGDGIDLVQHFREIDPAIGAVVVTGFDEPGIATRVVDSRVQGYLLKPFEHTELDVNIENAARWRELERESRHHRNHLRRLVDLRTAEVRASQWETIHRLALAAEFRDPETAFHLERMSSYSSILARRIGFGEERCEEIRLASPMHDIGKIGIPDHVLNHGGPFDAEQRAVMNQHTEFGWEILRGSNSPLLDTAAVIARSHHEWWDGSGYPLGLAGPEIPVEGRIVAIADVFDALLSRRRYKPPFTVDEAIALMESERGTHFDPELLDLFFFDVDELLVVRDAFAEPEAVSA